MTQRVVLYGANGLPAVVQHDGADKMAAVLLELFGAIVGVPGAMTRDDALGSIVAVLGQEVVLKRWPMVKLMAKPDAVEDDPLAARA